MSSSSGTPAVVVIGLLASRNYDYVVIHTDNGSSSKMWATLTLILFHY